MVLAYLGNNVYIFSYCRKGIFHFFLFSYYLRDNFRNIGMVISNIGFSQDFQNISISILMLYKIRFITLRNNQTKEMRT